MRETKGLSPVHAASLRLRNPSIASAAENNLGPTGVQDCRESDNAADPAGPREARTGVLSTFAWSTLSGSGRQQSPPLPRLGAPPSDPHRAPSGVVTGAATDLLEMSSGSFSRIARRQHIRRADDARTVPARGKCARERSLRAPARAVSGSADARTDAILQVRDRGLDALLHLLAAQVIAAEHDVNRHVGELPLSGEAGIHHARVRTGREHGDPAPAHDGGDEPR